MRPHPVSVGYADGDYVFYFVDSKYNSNADV